MTAARPRSRTLLIGGVVAALAVVAVVVFVFVLGDAPDEVNLDDAVAAADDASEGTTPSGDVDPQGTWTVDTNAQPYSFDDSTGTFVGFRIDEELSGVGATTAVGRTPDVTGTVTLDGATLSAATFTADLSALTTDDSRRDSKARGALNVTEEPLATFTLAAPVDLGAEPQPGDTVAATAVGDLTVNGVTQRVEVPLEAALSTSGLLVVTGSLDVTLADFDVSAPSAPIVLGASDVAIVEIQLYLTHA